ncbi:ricin-type beta-trefoil lectin domain protein [Kitasatospora sp. NBC_00374]|uniref:RICIN domain-containing protein n=1 Tax=Kitasatospora sp. NBC_00374 TaxID=2975964 RepID=UPI003253275D
MNTARRISAVAAVALAFSLANTGAAQAVSGTQELIAYGSTPKCATPQGNGTANGTPLTVWDCTGSDVQRFQFFSSGEVKHVQSGRCVTPRGNSYSNGTVLTLWDCTGSSVQKWNVGSHYDAGNNRTTPLFNSGQCITNEGNSWANGTWLTLWTCNSSWPAVQDWAVWLR